jgi:hypothetical protein
LQRVHHAVAVEVSGLGTVEDAVAVGVVDQWIGAQLVLLGVVEAVGVRVGERGVQAAVELVGIRQAVGVGVGRRGVGAEHELRAVLEAVGVGVDGGGVGASEELLAVVEAVAVGVRQGGVGGAHGAERTDAVALHGVVEGVAVGVPSERVGTGGEHLDAVGQAVAVGVGEQGVGAEGTLDLGGQPVEIAVVVDDGVPLPAVVVEGVVRDLDGARVNERVAVDAVPAASRLAGLVAPTVRGLAQHRGAEAVAVRIEEAHARITAVAVLVDAVVADLGGASVHARVVVVAVAAPEQRRAHAVAVLVGALAGVCALGHPVVQGIGGGRGHRDQEARLDGGARRQQVQRLLPDERAVIPAPGGVDHTAGERRGAVAVGHDRGERVAGPEPDRPAVLRARGGEVRAPVAVGVDGVVVGGLVGLAAVEVGVEAVLQHDVGDRGPAEVAEADVHVQVGVHAVEDLPLRQLEQRRVPELVHVTYDAGGGHRQVRGAHDERRVEGGRVGVEGGAVGHTADGPGDAERRAPRASRRDLAPGLPVAHLQAGVELRVEPEPTVTVVGTQGGASDGRSGRGGGRQREAEDDQQARHGVSQGADRAVVPRFRLPGDSDAVWSGVDVEPATSHETEERQAMGLGELDGQARRCSHGGHEAHARHEGLLHELEGRPTAPDHDAIGQIGHPLAQVVPDEACPSRCAVRRPRRGPAGRPSGRTGRWRAGRRCGRTRLAPRAAGRGGPRGPRGRRPARPPAPGCRWRPRHRATSCRTRRSSKTCRSAARAATGRRPGRGAAPRAQCWTWCRPRGRRSGGPPTRLRAGARGPP